jgi:two-component system sensor histidine kinase KdpD
LNDQIWQSTGVRVRETIPDWVLERADEVVMIDLTPRALLNRLARGAVYAPDKSSEALRNCFKESNLVALREMALRQTAHEVDVREVEPDELRRPARAQGTEPSRGERILIHITAHPSTAILIRRAWRIAEFLQAACFAAYVRSASARMNPKEEAAVEKHLRFARDLHIETRILEGERESEALVEFARLNKITQLFIARPQYKTWQHLFSSNPVHKIVRLAPDMRLTIIAERRQTPHTPR